MRRALATRWNGRLSRALTALTLGAVLALGAENVEACSCGAASIPAHASSSDVVFIGTITSIAVHPEEPTRSEGRSVWASSGSPCPADVTIRVDRALKGDPGEIVRLRSDGSSCDLPLAIGETWVVYARSAGSHLTASRCSRTRLLKDAAADVEYFDGLAVKRPQGVVWGVIARRGFDREGRPVSIAVPRNSGLLIAALADGRRYASGLDWSSFDLVLPAGEATIWVEQGGRRLTPSSTVVVADGGDHVVTLVIDDGR